MVYGLVKQHKGFVHLYSEPGQGTTVKLYLALAYREAVQPTAERADQMLPGGTESVLVVEDDASLRAVAERLLKKVGYRVVTAADGVEGMEAYRLHRSEIALVITDVVMPKAGGFDVYNDVRRLTRRQQPETARQLRPCEGRLDRLARFREVRPALEVQRHDAGIAECARSRNALGGRERQVIGAHLGYARRSHE